MYSAVENMINQIDTWVWGWWMILLLLGTHIFMTIRTGVIQRKIGTAIRLSVTKDPDGEGEVSQFGALTTALASTIGTGNIIGVGTAIALGGPGAVLWCWLTGVFGIATKYSESLIAVKYRVKTKDGRMPVSYTHLDVYKRQILSQRPIHGSRQTNGAPTADQIPKFGNPSQLIST